MSSDFSYLIRFVHEPGCQTATGRDDGYISQPHSCLRRLGQFLNKSTNHPTNIGISDSRPQEPCQPTPLVTRHQKTYTAGPLPAYQAPSTKGVLHIIPLCLPTYPPTPDSPPHSHDPRTSSIT